MSSHKILTKSAMYVCFQIQKVLSLKNHHEVPVEKHFVQDRKY